ncbi:hypothetical protein [Frisingicoccus sp.]|uniref:hypothetical protein n=1 Tax=Frisingicoccus sp. TaxID=1918627 RepID=UPI00399B0262
MFAKLLGFMAMTIYNQTYGTSTILNLIQRYNDIMEQAMGISAFTALITTIKSLAVGISILLYFIDLSEKVTEKNFSTQQFFQATLRCVIAYMFIMNSDIIVGYLMDLGEAVTNSTGSIESTSEFFNATRKTMLINGIGKLKISTILGYIMNAIIPWILSMISTVILQVILISRILEVVVLTTFSPLAISDIYREGTASSGVRYMKKVFALGLQIAVIILINLATQEIISSIIGVDAGRTITDLLKRTEYTGDINDALTSGTLVYTTDSLEQFFSALLGQGDKVKVYGIMLARLGLVWNSMPLCEEIAGAK